MSPTRRDIEDVLRSLADQEPPAELLDRLDRDVPPVLPAVERRSAGHPHRRPLALVLLAAAAALAVGVALAALLFRPDSPPLLAQRPIPTPTSLPAVLAPATPAPSPTAGSAPLRSTDPARSQVAAAPTAAPELPGRLHGRALDERRLPLPGVTVTASSPSGLRRRAISDVEGRFSLPGLPKGSYDVSFELSGFSTLHARVPLGAAEEKALEASIQPAAFEEAIHVTADTIAVDVSAAAMYTMSAATTQPAGHPGGRNYASVVTMPPSGVDENRFLIDGVDTAAPELIVVEAAESDDEWDDEELSDGQPWQERRSALRALDAGGDEVGELPLRHTGVEVEIAGFMARTVVTQTYANPFRETIEAVYVFPLGATAAVNDFVMQVGRRRIVGVVRPREQAERIYREARERGQTASLLTQERPNLFTQSVANIEPGGTVEITITTFETLAHDRGTFEYVFPMVVGPRYIPGEPTPAASRAVGGRGWSRPTTAVPDADRITPPVLRPGERSGHDINLSVDLDAGLPVTEIRSIVHRVAVSSAGATRRRVRLAKADTIPDRDFVLRWSVAGNALQAGAVAHRDGKDGYLALLVQPPLDPAEELVAAREISFVLDVSGSMSGVPIETSKALVRRVLDGLRPADAFNVYYFASGNGQLWPEARPSSPENVEEARHFLASVRGGGGTEMLSGLTRAIEDAHDPARLQMFVFCTDGYVGDEDRILAFVEENRERARFFAFGIGSSVNRFLIDGVGRLGGGASMVVLPREARAAEHAADRFFSMIDAPVLVDAQIDWNGLPVADVYPERLGDLFTGGAFTVVARYSAPASGTAYLTGRVGTRAVRFPIAVELPRRERRHAELAPVWARRRIAELSDQMLGADQADAARLREAITRLAVDFRLASPFTAFVAVDESEVRGNGRPRRVNQPVPMPQDVKHEGVFGPPR